MASMRLWVSGGATAYSHSGRVAANTTSCGDSSSMGMPMRASKASTEASDSLNTTTPSTDESALLLACTGAATYKPRWCVAVPTAA